MTNEVTSKQKYNYPSVICEYCTFTEYGKHSHETLTPNGYSSCEGSGCVTALDNYNNSRYVK